MPAMCFLHGFLKLLQKQISLRIVCVSLAHKPAYPGKLPRELTKRLASKKWPQRAQTVPVSVELSIPAQQTCREQMKILVRLEQAGVSLEVLIMMMK